MKKALLFFQLALPGFCLYAQTIVPRFETLGVNDGLSQSSVYSILQDREGFMWFGTGDGLNRYDGSEIKAFKFADDIHGRSNSNYVGKMCEDDKGNIWYANETGIYFYNRLQKKIEQARPFLKSEFPSNYLDIATLQNEVIYLDNILTGIVAYNIKDQKLTRYPFPDPIKGYNGYEHPINYPPDFHDNKIWLHGLLTKGLYEFDITTKKFTRFMPGQVMNGISFGLHFKYLLNTDKIFVLDDANKFVDTIQYYEKGRPAHFYNVVEDSYDHVWITTINSGIMLYERSTRKITVLRHENSRGYSVPVNAVSVIYNDANNNLWIGTDGGGVSKLDIKPKKFNLFPLNEGEYPAMIDYFTKCLYADNQDNVYFGTISNGLCIFNKVIGRLRQFKNEPGNKSSIQSNTVSAIFGDASHHIWVASSMGAAIFKDGVFSRIPIKNTPMLQSWNNLVNHFYQLSNGNVVAAARNGLIYFKNTPAGFEGNYIDKNGYEVSDIAEDGGHRIWIGCPGRGLQQITLGADTMNVIEQYFQGTNVRSLHVDERNPYLLWICTVNGLIRFDCQSKKFRIYNQSDGIANNYVYGALEDGNHNIWLSTNSGLSCFNRDDKSFKNYSVKDGLQSNEFNSGAFFKSASGTLYFGGVKGFNWFKPGGKINGNSAPLLGITAALVDDESILNESIFSSGEKVIVPYNKKSVLLRFAVLDYTLPQANTIEYKLEGWENKWFRTGNKDVRYTNLSPGNYTLRVHAINSADTKGKDTCISIIVLPPFWKTWSFIMIMILLAAIAVVLATIYISQKKLKQKLADYERQKEMERERQRISREMHDEIGAGLTQITLMSESVNKRAVKKQKELTDIAETSRRLVTNMSEIIWSMDPANNTIDEFFAYLRENIYNLLEYSNIRPGICFPEKGTDLVLNTGQKRNLLLVVKEATNNAIKHSGADEILVKAELTNEGLQFLIADNGSGFDAGKQTGGNGLNNIRRRISDLGGTISIKSGPGEGCQFEFFIPLKSHF